MGYYHQLQRPLSEHAYALYPLITIATLAIIISRIVALSHFRHHDFPSPWTTVVSFGDELTDCGNGAHITGGKYPNDHSYWHHRFSNGPNWVDNLITNFGGLDKVKMRNFAHGGATTDNALLPGSLLGHYIPSTHQQVRGFMLKSRHAAYPETETTLYTLWTGMNDCLALGGIGPAIRNRNFTTADIIDSVYQDILQMEHESHNKVSFVVVLTPPPVEDMPMVRNDKPEKRVVAQSAVQEIVHQLPGSLLDKFSQIGHATMTDTFQLAPSSPQPGLPNHRTRTDSPISHFLTVDLPKDYSHTLPHEHNGETKTSINTTLAQAHARNTLSIHSKTSPPDGLHHPLLKLHRRSKPSIAPSSAPLAKLHIMVYDAYHFIKHAQANPQCFDFNPAAVNQTCGDEPLSCFDRVWMDDTNLNTAVHYWMARDLNVRLRMWHFRITHGSLETAMKNSTRLKEIEEEMLGYACPMRPAPVEF